MTTFANRCLFLPLLSPFHLASFPLLTFFAHLHGFRLVTGAAVLHSEGLVHCNHLLIPAVTSAVGRPHS